MADDGLARGAWVITGAASGFGRAVARRLDERGEALVLLDRDARGLEETRAMLRGDRVALETADVTDPEAVGAALERAASALGPIAHVFHSAGVLAVGPARSVALSDYRRMIEVNYLGSVHVALAALPHLLAARGRATLTLVASVAGLRGFPQLAGYSASKFAVVGFAQALADELAGSNVRVKALCPPPGDTPMVRKLEKLPPVYKLSPLFSAETVADAALREVERPGLVALVDLRSKALWRVARFVPRALDLIVRFAR
ncbi:MAG TPA: SDR family NAD(P)-dependent oxidoreductase [Sandaracinaceae bacterium]